MPSKILIAEDYEDARTFMKMLVQSFGYEVLEAADGKQAVETNNEYCPDLILMDIAMPVMSGIEAAQTIRSHEHAGQRTPIICVTAHGDLYREEALSAGCDDLIPKPLDFDSLESLLSQHLGKNKNEE
jgi:CheY-like chemotaxis protein